MQCVNVEKHGTRHLGTVATGLSLWLVLVLLFASQFVIVSSFSWHDAFMHAGYFWLPWFFFMPAVAWVAFRFPLERNRFYFNLGVHVLACIVIVTASQTLFRKFLPMPPPPGKTEGHQPPLIPNDGPGGPIMDDKKWRPPPMEANEQGPGPFPESPKPQHHDRNAFGGLRAGLDFLVYWSLLSVCLSISNFRRSQRRERREAELEARLARSKLQSLRMQINPHFLFNTLNAISTLVYVNPRAADEMIGDLSELLRNSLDTANEQEITLARELEFIRHYAGIEKKRFGDRLKVEENIPAEAMNALVPALILQPLVENAIRHGIEPQRAPGVITIEARVQGDDLLLKVSDDGRGLVENPKEKNTRQGIGLSNTRARLRELYGAKQELVFGKREPRGCVVEIRMPYHTSPAPGKPDAPSRTS